MVFIIVVTACICALCFAMGETGLGITYLFALLICFMAAGILIFNAIVAWLLNQKD